MENLKINEVALSKILFPDQHIRFCPSYDLKQAKDNLICSVSGSRIEKGDFYYWYHPTLVNLSTKKHYRTSYINGFVVAVDYIDNMPLDFESYEKLAHDINTCNYEIDSSEYSDLVYKLYYRYGEDCLMPTLVKKK